MRLTVPPRILADQKSPILAVGLRTPRAAACAGMVFSILLITSFWLLRTSVPSDPGEIGLWLRTSSKRVLFALNLLPFAGIAFLWFLGVLRDRLGAKEDKFFATVFLGSGLLFLGMLFVSAAAMGAIILAHNALPGAAFDADKFAFARAFTYNLMHIYAFKMVAVFMITTSTLALNTHVTARWIALLGYASAAVILIGSGFLDWVLFVFPCWVLLVSIYILLDNLKKPPSTAVDGR
ncbi:MAG TPA: hypothetical protein VHU42_06170 [Rhodopila sp.]|nr:hypothetical protein [Rhodopila sp.]